MENCPTCNAPMEERIEDHTYDLFIVRDGVVRSVVAHNVPHIYCTDATCGECFYDYRGSAIIDAQSAIEQGR